jgi:hypothetical protein
VTTKTRYKYTVAWKDRDTGKIRRRAMRATVDPEGWLILKTPKGCTKDQVLTVQIDLPEDA